MRTKKEKYYVTKEDKNYYMICLWSNSYEAYIVNDGICNCYSWKTRKEAQEAADAYNEFYEKYGYYFDELCDHGYGYDRIKEGDYEGLRNGDEIDQEKARLFFLFNAVDYCKNYLSDECDACACCDECEHYDECGACCEECAHYKASDACCEKCVNYVASC